MKKTTKRVLSAALAVGMTVSVGVLAASCGDKEKSGDKSYTYKTSTTALGTNWNPHTWETNADSSILTYLSSPFVDMSIKDSRNGVYQWVYEMATSVEDVTKAHQNDLTKYNVTLQEGKTAETTDAGFVFEIKLNQNAQWENGEKINADDYIYSMKQLLDSKMRNYRANLYYAGESAVAGGLDYYNSEAPIYKEWITEFDHPDGEPTAKADGTLQFTLGGESKDIYTSFSATIPFFDDSMANVYNGGYAKYFYTDYEGDTTDKDNLPDYVVEVKDKDGNVTYKTDIYKKWAGKADSYGVIALTNDLLADLKILAVNFEEENPAAWQDFCLYYAGKGDVVNYDGTVGCYKVDDYTIRYVTQTYIDYNYFMTSLTSTWLVYEPYYEANKDTSGTLTTTKYGTSKANTMSYGPYKINSLQEEKQMVFVQNENWYGFEKQSDGSLVSYTNFDVDGKKVQQYQTTKIQIDVMDDNAAKQAFLKGNLSDWTPSATDLSAYKSSDQLYQVDETYTMSLFFNTGLEALKAMDSSEGNKNSVVLSNTNFRKALSLAVNRSEYVKVTPGYKAAYSLMSNLYYYDVYNDPTSFYRSTDEAMQAICNLYGVEYGADKPYKTLKEAYQSINGYNLTEAKALMKTAYDELVAAGLYTSGAEIKIRVAWAAGSLTDDDNAQIKLLNEYINAALEGSGFGKVILEAVGNLSNRYDAVPGGKFAIGYGAWGGAAFYPFRNFQVYMDPDTYKINEAGCYNPKTEELTLKVNGVDETMTWQNWSKCMISSGKYAAASNEVKLSITAQLEEAFLGTYYRIPLCSTTQSFLLSYQCNYYTENYNIMYDFGGMRLMTYNYTDAEWADYVKKGISYV